MIISQLSEAILPPTIKNIAIASIASAAAATALRFLIDPLLPPGVPYPTFWLAVDVATVVASWKAGVVTAVLSSVIGWWFWLWPEPGYSVIAVFLVFALLQVGLASVIREALVRLKVTESQRELLVRELAHRAKNQLAVIHSIVRQTLRTAKSVEEAHSKLEGRVEAFRAAFDLTLHPIGEVALRELCQTVVHPLRPSPERLIIEGAPLGITRDATQSVALVLFELATNAVKYGAWRGRTGAVTIRWRRSGNAFHLEWDESVDHTFPSAASSAVVRKGFGSQLIERSIPGSTVTIDQSAGRYVVKIDAPVEHLLTNETVAAGFPVTTRVSAQT